jgi:hypothetical protein
MASFESTVAVNLIAGEDLRGDVFEILQIEDDGGVGKVIKATAVTNTVIGILAENPRTDLTTDGLSVPVVLLQGKVAVKAGGAVTAGDLIVPDATAGRVIGVTGVGALAADSMAIGIALESAVDGDIFNMLAMPIAAPHSV